MSDDSKEKSERTVSYEEKLAAWKAAHGIEGAEGKEITVEDVMRAEDAKNHGWDYCWRCGDEFPIRDMIVDTNPYIQNEDRPHRDDGYIPEKYRIRVCKKCHAEEEAECGEDES